MSSLEARLRDARILIVDDHELDARRLAEILHQAGYSALLSLTDPREVLQSHLEFRPDLILLDLVMPHLDGFAVLEQLRPHLVPPAHLPVLVLTSDVAPEAKRLALQAGAKDFLTKPFDADEALARVRNLLETRFLHLRLQADGRALEEKVQERIAEVQEQAALIAKARDAILVRDARDEVAFWNDGAERLFGWTRAEALGKKVDLLLRSDPVEVRVAGEATMAHGEWVGELRRCTKADREVVVLSRWTLVRDDEGRPKSILIIDTDVTQRKSQDAQLLHAQRMEGIGMVAAGVAHDFNNLLTVISGFTELVIDRMSFDDPSRGFLQEVHKAGGRAAALTRQLLAFSRKQVLEPQVLDLNALVVDAEAMLSRLIGAAVRMELDLAAELGRVKADSGQLEQILLNLCVNARDAMPQGGRIVVSTRNVELDAAYAVDRPYVKPGSYVELSVRDTGTGMDEPTQARMFEPFFTTRPAGQGTGLGLPTVYGIVRQSGGSIECESAVGAGTTFHIHLPRVDDPIPPPKPPSGIHKPLAAAETLLLVDDDDAVRKVVQLSLRSLGYAVLEAADGPEALRLCESREAPIDLLVTDVVMPGMNGRELAERLRALRPGLKVLYISGYTGDEVLQSGAASGGAAFLAKPITPGMLGRKVRQVLDGEE